MTVASGSPPLNRPRCHYIDWLRGLAVVLMIEAHTFDAWTAEAWRDSAGFWYAEVFGGWAAPSSCFSRASPQRSRPAPGCGAQRG